MRPLGHVRVLALTPARRADTASVHGLLGVDAVWIGASAGGLPAWPICVR
jgi:hypothetical protein